MQTEKQICSEVYDYIVKTCQTQNKLLDINVLYGDGTRWNKRKDIFELVYNEIKKLLTN
jgi:hypothetical protein